MSTKLLWAPGKIIHLHSHELFQQYHRTWNAVVKLADELREKKVKIGFFSSTPQGGTWNFFQIMSTLADTVCPGGVALVCFDPLYNSSSYSPLLDASRVD